jgi:hypothetical protein
MPDYKYDVFLSYERDGLATGWITEHFLPHFRTWVRNEIAATCRRRSLPIFFDISQTTPNFPDNLKQDVAGIRPGANWDPALREALQTSRCMVGIWNPPYFFSDWCNLEWQSFDRRADNTGSDVLLAASFHDGNSFPEKAAARQRLDFSPYTLFGPALINSRKYEEFQDNVKLLARYVALAVQSAPPFQAWALAEDTSEPPARPPLPVTRF